MNYTETSRPGHCIVKILFPLITILISQFLFCCSTSRTFAVTSSDRRFERRNHFFIHVDTICETSENEVNRNQTKPNDKYIIDTFEVLRIYEHPNLYVIIVSNGTLFQIVSLKQNSPKKTGKIREGESYFMHLMPQYRHDEMCREIISPIRIENYYVYVQCIGGMNIYISPELVGINYNENN